MSINSAAGLPPAPPGWKWTKVKDMIRETAFSCVYQACKAWKGWTGKGGFFDWMAVVRRPLIKTLKRSVIAAASEHLTRYGRNYSV